MDEFELELKLDFLEEATSLLEDCEESFLELESCETDPTEHIDKIFRLAHNLKGTSRAVEFSDVAEFTHEMEELILKVKNGTVQINERVIDIFLKCADHINTMISSLKEDIEAKFDSSELLEVIRSVDSADVNTEELKIYNLSEDRSTEDSPESIDEEKQVDEDAYAGLDALLYKSNEKEVIENNVETVEDDKYADLDALLYKEDTKVTATEAKVEDSENDQYADLDALLYGSEKPPVLKEVTPVMTKPTEVEASKESTPSKKVAAKKKPEESIRVGLGRVEKLNNYVGELVILQTVLNESSELLANTYVRKSISHLSKITKEIQNISMKMRMVPLKTTFSKLQRIVRDTSKALGKEVNLVIEGDDTEVDKNILDKLSDPLVHIIRNAVDHGLEKTSEERVMAGKSEKGQVKLTAFHEGNNLVIEVVDDGKGIDPKVIRSLAVKKGVIRESDRLNDNEIINLIFAPGFSTKEAVSEISGRGVGMDVVKKNITNISGVVDVKSEIGKGSVFKIKLPLTMAIIEGMVSEVNSSRYVVPLNLIQETVPVTEENYKRVSNVGGCIVLRGQVMPAFRLSGLLKHSKTEAKKNEIALIITTEDYDFAVLVDDVLRRQQVVIKTLGADIKSTKGFMGSSILGDGKPALILDLKELVVDKLNKITSKKIA